MNEPMIAVEFQALVKDGTIEVPEPYREQLSGVVRVIVLRSEQTRRSKIIERLMEQPIQDPTFRPLRRDEIYNRHEQ